MTEQNRTQRELTSRALTERPKQWTPPELLPEPDKEAGMSYRWIRVSMLSQADPRNTSSRFREGWEPVKLEEQPKFKLLVNPDSRFKDNIEVGGLLLCKTPTELVEQQQAYYANLTRQNEEAVNNSLMRQSDARMPLFNERKSAVSFGKGN
jgi:hypothetical protein